MTHGTIVTLRISSQNQNTVSVIRNISKRNIVQSVWNYPEFITYARTQGPLHKNIICFRVRCQGIKVLRWLGRVIDCIT